MRYHRRFAQIAGGKPVRNLDYHSFVHRFTRFVGREERIQYVESAASLDSLAASLQGDWVNALEKEIPPRCRTAARSGWRAPDWSDR